MNSTQYAQRIERDVEAWRKVEADHLDEIDRLTQIAAEYDKQIADDLEADGATAETAAAKLNRDHTNSKISAEWAAIATHEPLYAMSEYDSMCAEIRDAYKADAKEGLAELNEHLTAAKEVLERIDSLRKDAGECQRTLEKACCETGTNVNIRLARPNVGSQIISPNLETYLKKTLDEMIRRLKV